MEGSPPRMRGKGTQFLSNLRCVGITPAYAGKSRGHSQCRTNRRDHPRVCGEKCGDHLPRLVPKGSPPRVRGKGGRCPLRGLRDRITPACAGKSCSSTGRAGGRGDHPRVCGEKCGTHGLIAPVSGSPPRVRGKARRAVHDRSHRGITPACAGKSVFRRSFTSDSGGSPPRVRGKVRPHEKQRDRYGITPACAGKRRFWSRRDTLD